MRMLLLWMLLLGGANQTAVSQAIPLPPFGKGNALAQTTLRPPSWAIPSTFFGMHIHNMSLPRPSKTPEPWPTVPFGSWRLWDSRVAWPNLEPAKGEWHFDILDKNVALAEQHRVDVLLPLGMSPTWVSARQQEKGGYNPGSAAEPKSLDEWRDYVNRVTARYKGSIHNYEIWNEPNQRLFYTGDTQQLVTLTCEAYKIIKAASPDNKVISPSATDGQKGVAWLDDFLAKGGGQCVDVIGFHFYANTPEEMLPIIAGARGAMARNHAGNKQLWNTETGWPFVNHVVQSNVNPTGGKILGDDEASAFIARAYLLQWADGVSRWFFYAWDNKAMGLTEVDGETVKAPAAAYARIYDWLNGSIMNSCTMDRDGTWVVELTRPDRSQAWIVWNPKGKTRWVLPGRVRTPSITDITGKPSPSSPDGTLTIDITPKLIQVAR